jgi:hypothetical protein
MATLFTGKSAASREFTGQGPVRGGFHLVASAPPIAIARDGNFAPTRSARTPPVAHPLRDVLEKPVPLMCSRKEAHHEFAQRHPPERERLLEIEVSLLHVANGRLWADGIREDSCGQLPSFAALATRSSALLRVASHAPPRRGTRSAAPEVPSVAGRPLSGPCRLFHRLSPACGVLDRRLFRLLVDPSR